MAAPSRIHPGGFLGLCAIDQLLARDVPQELVERHPRLTSFRVRTDSRDRVPDLFSARPVGGRAGGAEGNLRADRKAVAMKGDALAGGDVAAVRALVRAIVAKLGDVVVRTAAPALELAAGGADEDAAARLGVGVADVSGFHQAASPITIWASANSTTSGECDTKTSLSAPVISIARRSIATHARAFSGSSAAADSSRISVGRSKPARRHASIVSAKLTASPRITRSPPLCSRISFSVPRSESITWIRYSSIVLCPVESSRWVSTETVKRGPWQEWRRSLQSSVSSGPAESTSALCRPERPRSSARRVQSARSASSPARSASS